MADDLTDQFHKNDEALAERRKLRDQVRAAIEARIAVLERKILYALREAAQSEENASSALFTGSERERVKLKAEAHRDQLDRQFRELAALETGLERRGAWKWRLVTIGTSSAAGAVLGYLLKWMLER